MIPLAASAALSAASAVTDLLGAAGSSGSSGSSGATDTKPAKAGDTVTQADFMQLLIAQLQNQDPLNPLDSANFSAQLAQFSSLQQLTEIKDTLKKGTGSNGTTSQLDAVGFLGKDVRGTTNTVTVHGGVASTLSYTLASGGTVGAHVVDASGRTVADLVLGPQTAGAHDLDLASVPNASKLADGTYTVTVAATDGSGTAQPVPTVGGGTVTGVDLSGDAPVLLIGDVRLALTDVREVKEHTAAGA